LIHSEAGIAETRCCGPEKEQVLPGLFVFSAEEESPPLEVGDREVVRC